MTMIACTPVFRFALAAVVALAGIGAGAGPRAPPAFVVEASGDTVPLR